MYGPITRKCMVCGDAWLLTPDEVNRAMGTGIYVALFLQVCKECRDQNRNIAGTEYGKWFEQAAHNNESYDKETRKVIFEVQRMIKGNRYYQEAKKEKDRELKRIKKHLKSNIGSE